MGCGDSKPKPEEKYEAADEDHHIEYEHEHQDAEAVPSKLDPKERILIKCGGVFVCAAKESMVECLLFYPDLGVTGKAPCHLISRNLRRQTDLPAWSGVRVQFKEFDSYDDIYKDWFERANKVPGLLNNTCASPFASWVTLNPNTYQSRYVLPNGRRMWSPVADKGNYHYSVPQRLFALHKGYDTEANRRSMERLMKRIHKLLPAIKLGLIQAGITSPLEALFFEPEDVLEPLLEELPEFEHYNTVHEIRHPDLQDLKEILGEMEDNLMYNWWQIQSSANIQIGAFQEDLAEGEIKHKKTIWDRGLGLAVDGADAAADVLRFATHTSVEGKMNEQARRWVYPHGDNYEISEDDDLDPERALSFLFPDLAEMVDAATFNLTAKATGITTEHLEAIDDPTTVEEILEEYRQMDRVPRGVRRRRLYERTAEKVQEAMQSMSEQSDVASIDGMSEEHQQILGEVARVPQMVEQFFMPFTFFCVFPFFDPEVESSTKRPNNAVLVLWPTGLSREHNECQRIPMKDLDIDFSNKKEAPVAAKLSENLFEGAGESSIDSDDEDDPRNGWIPYPSAQFRGFEATTTVALNLTYNFYFELDGVNFLDHDSWCVREDKIQYRRARFQTRCGHVAMNPIKEMGLII